MIEKAIDLLCVILLLVALLATAAIGTVTTLAAQEIEATAAVKATEQYGAEQFHLQLTAQAGQQ